VCHASSLSRLFGPLLSFYAVSLIIGAAVPAPVLCFMSFQVNDNKPIVSDVVNVDDSGHAYVMEDAVAVESK